MTALRFAMNCDCDADSRCSKFINCLMRDGKKSTAQRVLMDTFDLIKTNGLSKCAAQTRLATN